MLIAQPNEQHTASQLSWADFCYWLQGAIEIGNLKTFSSDQTTKIKHMAQRVGSPNGFVLGVVFALSFYPPDKAFELIYKDLQAAFQHDIDPTYAGDQAHFLAVHRGEADPIHQTNNHA
jgi:hypothetical protein